MSRELFIQYIKESDARSDESLRKYQVQTQALGRLSSMKDNAFLGVGLKGAGKSASFRLLCEDLAVDLVQPISAQTQEPYSIAGMRPTLQYVEELKGDLLLQTLVSLVQSPQVSRTRTKLDGALTQEASVLVSEIWGKAKHALGSLAGFSILGCGISFRSAGKREAASRLTSRNQYSDALSLVSRITEKCTVRLVIDDPEAIFTTADASVNENLVAALCIASHELQKKIPNWKCIILIKPNILRPLRRVDEFASIPLNSRVKLTWTDKELKSVLLKRAEAADISLRDAFLTDPERALDLIVADSRTGPRDALRRLELHFDAYPNDPVTPQNLERSIGTYSDACFDQMVAAYDRQYPGLSRVALMIFEGKQTRISKVDIDARLDQMIASSKEILTYKDQQWARDAAHLADLLLQFGLVAVEVDREIHLPYHSTYAEAGAQQGAVFVSLPALRGRLRRSISTSSLPRIS